MRRCRRRGEAGLLGMLFLGAAAAVALAAWHAGSDAERRTALERGVGKTLAGWMLAADRASRRPAVAQRFVTGGHVGFALTFAELRALGVVPPGLPDAVRGGTIGVGIVPDRPGGEVPMGFAVLQPVAGSEFAVSGWRSGAREGGLSAVLEAGDGRLAPHLGPIGTVLGAPPAADTVFATADASVRRENAVLHRHRIAGAPHLNRMETALEFDGAGIGIEVSPGNFFVGVPPRYTGAGEVSGRSAVLVGNGTVRGGGTVAGGASVGAPLDPRELRSGTLAAGNVVLSAGPLTVVADLVTGTGRATGAVSAGSLEVAGLLGGGSVTAAGALTAGGPLAVDGTAAVTGSAVVAGAVNGERTELGAGTFTVSSSVDAGSAYGPAASFDRMTVGSCDGCDFW